MLVCDEHWIAKRKCNKCNNNNNKTCKSNEKEIANPRNCSFVLLLIGHKQKRREHKTCGMID